jgi:hypothetical protein
MMTDRRRRLATCAVIALGVPAGEAAAQEPGVFVNPDSPAGQEYALPLTDARREHAGSGDRSGFRQSPLLGAEAARVAPLFGAGITPRPPATASDRGRPGGAGTAPYGQRPPASAPGSGAAASPRAVADAAKARSSAGELVLPLLAILAVAGVAAGLLVLIGRRKPSA